VHLRQRAALNALVNGTVLSAAIRQPVQRRHRGDPLLHQLPRGTSRLIRAGAAPVPQWR